MARLRDDLESEIIAVATTHFLAHGFEEVNMRSIARDVGIAVGTLYNYFPNKRELFCQAFITGWQTEMVTLQEISEAKIPPRQRISDFLAQFRQAVIRRQGLAIDFFRLAASEPKDSYPIQQVRKRLKGLLSQVLLEAGVERQFCQSLSQTLLLFIWGVAKQADKYDEDPQHYIDWLLSRVLDAEGVVES